MIDAEFVARYTLKAEGVRFFGEAVTTLTREELLAVVGYAANYIDQLREMYASDRRMQTLLSEYRLTRFR